MDTLAGCGARILIKGAPAVKLAQQPMRRFFWIRLRMFLRRCAGGGIVMAAWFAFGTAAFHVIDGLPLPRALAVALYLGYTPSGLWELYSFWGQCVLFGIVISVFLLQAVQQYNPQEACRMLAKEMKDHAIVIGYTHLGQRIVDYLRQAKHPYVLIDRDATAVDDLVRAGEPVIVDNAREASTLEEAGIARARLLVLASNNIETALLVTRLARARNPQARIIVRCYQDEFVDLLGTLGASEVISSSKSAFREIEAHLALQP